MFFRSLEAGSLNELEGFFFLILELCFSGIYDSCQDLIFFAPRSRAKVPVFFFIFRDRVSLNSVKSKLFMPIKTRT